MNKMVADFFVAGGTLRPDTSSYVKRPADDELFKLALAGEFCYVLTPRQMGKSSLMVRTARRLQEHGVKTAIVDLTKVGTTKLSIEQWYLGLLTQVKRGLRLSVDLKAWWQEHASLGYVQRFTDFLGDVILSEIESQAVIFIDEIDTTLKLDSRDDFFAAIRAMYNARASEPQLNRLTFVLLGVASPPDLIKDRDRTPFNIGTRIALHGFSQTDAAVLRNGLEALHPGQGETIFTRIYYWTQGHPYLTQKLCLTVVESGEGRWTDKRVDHLVEDLFLSDAARKETNLQFVQDKILTYSQRRKLLKLYKKVLRGKRVEDEGQSLIQNELKLAGLVEAKNGYLRVCNEIYRRIFDLAWIRENTPPINWTPIIAGIMLLLVIGFILYYFVAPRFCPPGQWCSQNDQRLKGMTVFALAACDDGTLFAGAENGIYHRAPGDTQWKLEHSTDGEVRGLAASSDCTLVYAATLNGGILRRDDSSWSVVSEPDMIRARVVALSGNVILGGGDFGLRSSLADRVNNIWESPMAFDKAIVSLARSEGRLYAAVWGEGVWYCDDDNLDQWQSVTKGIETPYILQVIGSPVDGTPRFVGTDVGFYRWNGTQWEKYPEPWGNIRTFWFIIDGDMAYAGQEDNGVLRSADGGLTWEPMNAGWETPPFRVRTLLLHVDQDGRRELYAGTNEGVWRYVFFKTSTTPTGITTPVSTSSPTLTATATLWPTDTPSPTPSPTPLPTDTNTPTPTLTPTGTPSPGAPSPGPTHTPTETPLPTNTPTRTPTRIVQAVKPALAAPVAGSEVRNPATFRWSGALNPGEMYQVTLFHPKNSHTIQSPLQATSEWGTDLPGDKFGEWRWTVSVVRAGSVAVRSEEWMFWFVPGGGGGPGETPAPTSAPTVPPP